MFLMVVVVVVVVVVTIVFQGTDFLFQLILVMASQSAIAGLDCGLVCHWCCYYPAYRTIEVVLLWSISSVRM
jgi:hypothetical protein